MEKLISAFKIKPYDTTQYKTRLEQEFILLSELNYIDYIFINS